MPEWYKQRPIEESVACSLWGTSWASVLDMEKAQQKGPFLGSEKWVKWNGVRYGPWEDFRAQVKKEWIGHVQCVESIIKHKWRGSRTDMASWHNCIVLSKKGKERRQFEKYQGNLCTWRSKHKILVEGHKVPSSDGEDCVEERRGYRQRLKKKKTILNEYKYFSFIKWELKVRRSYFMFMYLFNLTYPAEICILKSVF